jgi:NADPH-dependent 2,4-dienoyl-CoA reductase/sulfur reductase-like enzyme
MSASHVKYILIGGGLASSEAVQAIRRHDPDGSILLVGQEVNRPYHRPALSRDYLLGRISREQLFTLSDDWFADNNVELRTGRRASHLDPPRHSVTLDDGQELIFDNLLIATGASPRPLKVPGAELPSVLYLRTLADAERLRNAVDKARLEGRPHPLGRGKAVVVGGGLLGIELASTLVSRGLAVDSVFTGPFPWHRFAGENTGRFMARLLEAGGIRLHPLSTPLRLEGDGRVQHVIIPESAPIDCDFVVAAIGIVPHRELLRGTAITAEKAILVDDHCRTSSPGIFAAGDCAAILDPAFGRYRLLDHWSSAQATGAIAGANMAGQDQRYDQASEFESTVFGLALRAWGDARSVERRIIRGNLNPDAPDFIEFGISGDGRVAQVLALNHSGDHQLVRELVRRRIQVEGKESVLREPASNLDTLL